MTATVSVITAVKNGAATLARCLDSVAAQAPHVVEHVVVDGQSCDGTCELVRARIAAGDGRLKLISGRDHGIADAWNKGILAATGDWIGILGADDWYEPGALARLVPLMTAEAILHGRTRLHDPRSGRSRESGPLPWIPEKHFRPLEKMPAQHPTCFVPRSLYERLGLFNTGFRVAMDYDFLLRAHLAGVTFNYVPEVIANFSLGGASGKDPAATQREVLASQIVRLGAVMGPLKTYLCSVYGSRLRHARRRLLGRPL